MSKVEVATNRKRQQRDRVSGTSLLSPSLLFHLFLLTSPLYLLSVGPLPVLGVSSTHGRRPQVGSRHGEVDGPSSPSRGRTHTSPWWTGRTPSGRVPPPLLLPADQLLTDREEVSKIHCDLRGEIGNRVPCLRSPWTVSKVILYSQGRRFSLGVGSPNFLVWVPSTPLVYRHWETEGIQKRTMDVRGESHTNVHTHVRHTHTYVLTHTYVCVHTRHTVEDVLTRRMTN